MAVYLCVSLAVYASESAHRVGPGDLRAGYESGQFRSQSEALKLLDGEPQPLRRLALSPPLGLPRLTNVPSDREIALGRKLFFDRRLSANATLSCGMCHIPEQGFTQNELATPVGIEGRSVRRNVPALYNVAYFPALFLDGRETQLDAQIWAPLLAENEMGNVSREQVVNRLRALPEYGDQFLAVYANGLTQTTLGQALAAYQQVLLSAASPFDTWYFGGVSSSLDPQAKQGFEVFVQSGCNACHQLSPGFALFTDAEFHNTGVGYLRSKRKRQPQQVQLAPGVFVTPSVEIDIPLLPDKGREEVTGDAQDRWKYRTPTLRNVALTAPFMHDGSIPTLDAVIAFYVQGGGNDPRQDQRIKPLNLTAQERQALRLFLESLTGNNVDALATDARSVAVGDTK